MGDWTITIHGTGCHHNANNYPADADKIAAACVAQLQTAGHKIKSAMFTHGGRDDLLPDDVLATVVIPAGAAQPGEAITATFTVPASSTK